MPDNPPLLGPRCRHRFACICCRGGVLQGCYTNAPACSVNTLNPAISGFTNVLEIEQVTAELQAAPIEGRQAGSPCIELSPDEVTGAAGARYH